jgi:hypothetical protein
VTDVSQLPRYYVTVQGDDTADTGFTYVRTADSGKKTTESYYLALLIGQRILLVRSKAATIGTTVTGSLENISADLRDNVIAKIEADVPDVKGAFLPVLLDTSSFAGRGTFGLIVAAVIVLLSLGGMGLALFRFVRPEAHPAIKALRRFGDPESVMREIDMEMAMNPQTLGKHAHLTNHWLVSTQNGLHAAPFRDVVWCYKLVTQHRTNGIPTGKTYAAKLFDRHGTAITIAGKQPLVDQIVQAVAGHAPGIMIGYSDEVSKMWSGDRQALIQAVDQRRAGGSGLAG